MHIKTIVLCGMLIVAVLAGGCGVGCGKASGCGQGPRAVDHNCSTTTGACPMVKEVKESGPDDQHHRLAKSVENARRRAALPPRKTIVGTCVYPMYGAHPGVEARLEALGRIVDEMSAKAHQQYGRGLDLAALPETAVNAGLAGSAPESGLPLEGPVLEAMAEVARRNNCYIVLPMYRRMENNRTENVAVLLDRDGRVTGQYSKIHCVDSARQGCLEGGIDGGSEANVFQCDFGRLGLQICFDMFYDDGWRALEEQGADLVVWTTMSPGRRKTAARAIQHQYYILTSTWRHNAGLYDPTGECVAAVDHPQKPGEASVLVSQVDLSYALVGWHPGGFRNGQGLRDKFGDKVDYRYCEAEDGGIFWSNDPQKPVLEMVRSLDLELSQELALRNLELQNRLRAEAKAHAAASGAE